MIPLASRASGKPGWETVPGLKPALEVRRATLRCLVSYTPFLGNSGGPAESAVARADISIPGRLDPLSCRDAGGCTSSRSCQQLIRRMRHCPRRNLRVIRFPDPRPTAPGPFLGVCGRGVFGGQFTVGGGL